MAKCWIKWTIHNWLKITSFKKNIITVWNTSGLDNQFNIKPSICSSLSWPFLYGFEPTKLRHVINSIYLFIKPSICLLSASNLHILISHFGRYFTIFFAVFFLFFGHFLFDRLGCNRLSFATDWQILWPVFERWFDLLRHDLPRVDVLQRYHRPNRPNRPNQQPIHVGSVQVFGPCKKLWPTWLTFFLGYGHSCVTQRYELKR